MPEVSLKQIKEFFGYESLAAFGADWKLMPTADREQIKAGLGDGTLNY